MHFSPLVLYLVSKDKLPCHAIRIFVVGDSTVPPPPSHIARALFDMRLQAGKTSLVRALMSPSCRCCPIHLDDRTVGIDCYDMQLLPLAVAPPSSSSLPLSFSHTSSPLPTVVVSASAFPPTPPPAAFATFGVSKSNGPFLFSSSFPASRSGPSGSSSSLFPSPSGFGAAAAQSWGAAPAASAGSFGSVFSATRSGPSGSSSSLFPSSSGFGPSDPLNVFVYASSGSVALPLSSSSPLLPTAVLDVEVCCRVR